MTHEELMGLASRTHDETMASAAKSPNDPCDKCGGDLWGCTCPIPDIKLFWAAALPYHYIALTRMGHLYLVSALPIGPEVWHHAERYCGRYEVLPVSEEIRRMYGSPDGGWIS
jgi:hypothetical protein